MLICVYTGQNTIIRMIRNSNDRSNFALVWKPSMWTVILAVTRFVSQMCISNQSCCERQTLRSKPCSCRLATPVTGFSGILGHCNVMWQYWDTNGWPCHLLSVPSDPTNTGNPSQADHTSQIWYHIEISSTKIVSFQFSAMYFNFKQQIWITCCQAAEGFPYSSNYWRKKCKSNSIFLVVEGLKDLTEGKKNSRHMCPSPLSIIIFICITH